MSYFRSSPRCRNKHSAKSRQQIRQRKLLLETMEDRALMATFTFSGETFEQNSTPDIVTSLDPATYSGAIVDRVPSTAAGSSAFPDNPSTGFKPELALGYYLNTTGGPRAVNLPNGNNGTTHRSGISTTWSNGRSLANAPGKDFVVYEAGSNSVTPEGFMVQVYNASTSSWSSWRYEAADSFSLYVGQTAEGAFATVFDLSDFGVQEGEVITELRIVNLTDEDRMEDASGEGTVIPEDNGATSTYFPNPGPLATGFTQYGTSTLDPDPLYLGVYNATIMNLVVDDISTDTDDLDYTAGHLTLREAINLSNAYPGENTITFSSALNNQTITLDSQLTVSAGVKIIGPGADLLTISGDDASRIFNVDSATAVEMSGLTLTAGNGDVDSRGGAIANSGLLTISDSYLTGNHVTNEGGAILNVGTLTIISSTLANNSSSIGAAIANTGALTVVNSTLSGNSASFNGGGLWNNDSTAVLVNSTITGNRADDQDASGYSGGGIYVVDFTTSQVVLYNTIVAGNFVGSGSTANDIGGKDLDSGSSNNLIGDPASPGGLMHGVGGNIVGDGSGNLLDVSLILNTTLADNGGTTLTHALAAGSAAIDAGDSDHATLDGQTNSTALTTDQRGTGFARVLGSAVDIGAFEEVPNLPPTLTVPDDITVGNDPGQGTAVVNFDVTFDDDAAGASIMQTAGLPSGSSFPVGTTTNTFVVTDAGGLMTTKSFDVTVEDQEAPTLSVPTDVEVETDAGLDTAVVTYTAPMFGDNAPGVTIQQIAGLASGSAFPLGDTVNTFVVTDGSGNMTMDSFTVTVHDNEAPVISVPMNISVGNDPGQDSAVVNYTTPTFTDNVAGGSIQQTAGLPAGSAFPLGTTVNTFVATDAAGNTSSASFNVTVTDSEAPLVKSITRGSSSPTSDEVVSYMVMFTEPVTGVDLTDFSLTTAGLSGASVVSVTGMGRNYTVSVNTGTGSGTLRLDVIDDDSIIDASSNPLGGPGLVNGTYIVGEVYDITEPQPAEPGEFIIAFDPANATWYGSHLSTGNSQILSHWASGRNWRDGLVADFNNDGVSDIAARTGSGAWYVALAQPGNDPLYTAVRWGKTPAAAFDHVATGDVNADGKQDIIAYSAASKSRWFVLTSTGDRFRSQALVFNSKFTWTDYVVGDFNGDGRTDLGARVQTTGSRRSPLWVSTTNANGVLQKATIWDRWDNKNWTDVLTADYNGDGKVDIVGRDADTGTWQLAQSNGSKFVDRDLGSWVKDSRAGWHDVLIADLNGDGKDDIVGQAANGRWLYIHQEGNADIFSKSLGIWKPAEQYESIFAGDLNHDGKDELFGRRGINGLWRIDQLKANGLKLERITGALYRPNWDESVDWLFADLGHDNEDLF